MYFKVGDIFLRFRKLLPCSLIPTRLTLKFHCCCFNWVWDTLQDTFYPTVRTTHTSKSRVVVSCVMGYPLLFIDFPSPRVLQRCSIYCFHVVLFVAARRFPACTVFGQRLKTQKLMVSFSQLCLQDLTPQMGVALASEFLVLSPQLPETSAFCFGTTF